MTQQRHGTDEKPTAFAAFEPVLSRWTTEELRDAAEAVETLPDHPGFQVLHRVVGEKKEREMARLLHGGVLPQANYAAVTAVLSGLDQVLHVAQSVQYMAERRAKQEAEEARQALARERDAA